MATASIVEYGKPPRISKWLSKLVTSQIHQFSMFLKQEMRGKIQMIHISCYLMQFCPPVHAPFLSLCQHESCEEEEGVTDATTCRFASWSALTSVTYFRRLSSSRADILFMRKLDKSEYQVDPSSWLSSEDRVFQNNKEILKTHDQSPKILKLRALYTKEYVIKTYIHPVLKLGVSNCLYTAH